MDPQSWRQVRALFDELIELQPEQQEERLAAIGTADPGLRKAVAALLSADGEADAWLGGVEAALLSSPTGDDSGAPLADPFRLTGRTLSHFRVVEPLGAGGMGVVYRAEDLRLNRAVALKVPLSDYRSDSSSKQRFLREARSAAALDHPNLCSIYEVGETEEGHPFLAMPLYPGETLKARLAREDPLPVGEAVEIAGQIAEGLAAAQDAGIVHRDIKPGNVMLLPGGAVKILDFGLAKVRGLNLTGSRTQLGTVAYMAPEQIRAEPVDGSADLWALGVVLYEMLTGRRPFEGEHDVSVAHAIVHQEPPRPSALRGEIPRSLEALLFELLRKQPARRPESARQVVAALAALQSGGALPLRRALGQRWTNATGWRGGQGWRRATGILLAAGVAGVALLGALTVGGADTPLLMFRASPEAPALAAPAAPAPARTAIAVLRFQNLSGDGEHAFFAAALHAELLTQLSKVAALTVISRTSVLAYEGAGTPLKEMASELGVGSVLEGSVQVIDGRLRVNVQLIDAATGAHLWSNRYDRVVEDAFAIQSDIAQQIVAAVGVRLSSAEQLRLAEVPTANTEAYQLYLQARSYLYAPAAGDLRERLDIVQQLLEQALALDPAFALAYVVLSEVHGVWYFGRDDPTPERAARQWEAAEMALRLAPDLPQAHLAMGLAYYYGRRDYRQALEWFARGLNGLPNDQRLWELTGYVHRRLGNWNQASVAFEKATQLDPRGRTEAEPVGNTSAIQRRYAEAVHAYNRTLQMNPDAHTVAVWKGSAYLHWEGQLDTLRAVVSQLPADQNLGGAGTRAAQHLRLLLLERHADSLLYHLRAAGASTFEGQHAVIPAALYTAWAHQLRGDRRAALAAFDSARVVLDSLVQQRPEDPRVRTARGLALAGLGRRAEALREADWLQRSEIYRNDAFEGPILAEQRARILAQAGEAEAALDELERLLSRPSWISVHTLRLDPLLDPLRGHPRYQALLTGAVGRQVGG
jgi:eukaryotic-like serine/threonine-protein kinase